MSKAGERIFTKIMMSTRTTYTCILVLLIQPKEKKRKTGI